MFHIILGGAVVILSLLIFGDWFFGEEKIDDRQGFPYSRK
jgi:hypothetical protein